MDTLAGVPVARWQPLEDCRTARCGLLEATEVAQDIRETVLGDSCKVGFPEGVEDSNRLFVKPCGPIELTRPGNDLGGLFVAEGGPDEIAELGVQLPGAPQVRPGRPPRDRR